MAPPILVDLLGKPMPHTLPTNDLRTTGFDLANLTKF
jgi:hypothetical protein